MIYFPRTINIVSTRLYCHIIYISNEFTSHFPAMHVNLLCACGHSEAVKGPSSLSTRRLLISLCITSFLFLCPEPTDAPCSHYGDPTPPFPRWRPYPQGPHTLPYQGPRQEECRGPGYFDADPDSNCTVDSMEIFFFQVVFCNFYLKVAFFSIRSFPITPEPIIAI
jgi:hypothetical protein